MERDGLSLRRKQILDLSPLHYAVCANNVDVIKLLVEYGVELDSEIYFRTPLDEAIWCGNIDAVEFLLPLIKEPRNNPIETALAAGNIQIYNFLKSKGFTTKRTLEIAAKYGNYKMLEYLEEHGEFKSLDDNQIAEAISEVERLENLYGALYLFKIGADIDINIITRDRYDLLNTAVKLEKNDLVERLLSKGFDPKKKDTYRYNALDYALSTKNDDIIKLLKRSM